MFEYSWKVLFPRNYPYISLKLDGSYTFSAKSQAISYEDLVNMIKTFICNKKTKVIQKKLTIRYKNKKLDCS